MASGLEGAMYDLAQLFLIPVLFAIAGLFGYAFVALGAFLWQLRQRRRGDAVGYELVLLRRHSPELSLDALESVAVQRLEVARIATRIAPLLGLVATMIPMGPALKGLADGNLADMSRGLMVAFSAVILALIASALTFWIVSVRRRWYAQDLAMLEGPSATAAVVHDVHAAEVPA